ncbi:MAG: hypothetical protein C0508_09715 [Cyanobacteria bacterium PR.023]|nr:hypothetical protein [Cyanobacteria bacterium PR.023]
MASSSRSKRPNSDVFGTLILSSASADLIVQADGEEITVSLPPVDGSDLSALNKKVRFHLNALNLFHHALSDMGVRLVVKLSGRTIAVLGRDSHPGLLSKLLSVAPLQLKLLPLMSALLRQKNSKSI